MQEHVFLFRYIFKEIFYRHCGLKLYYRETTLIIFKQDIYDILFRDVVITKYYANQTADVYALDSITLIVSIKI